MIAAVLLATATARAGEILVEDIFGRRLNEHGLTLVDWEGPIANPAIKVFVVPPEGAAFPARAMLTSTQPRAYFNLPSKIGPRGPSKTLTFNTREKQPVFVSIFPDREAKNLDFALQLNFKDAAGQKRTMKIPCHVIDQDKPPGDDATTSAFPIDVDFSQDRTDFFNDHKNRRVVEEAVHDWAYFLAPVARDPVRVGAEKTFIWDPDGFKQGHDITNAREDSGYLLYAYGIHGPELRSGGEASLHGGFQGQNGKELAVRRSGGYEAETRGNYNTLGWLVSVADGDYWKATNLRKVPNDLLSIAHHEIGHALFFSSGNTRFDRAQRAGRLEDAAVRDYLGVDPKIDKSAHFAGSIDPASRCGAFGNEYHGDVPFFRWQITKLDLLCAQAVGYKLRETSAFVPVTIRSESPPDGTIGKAYKGKIDAAGGIPFYQWDVTAGALPAGLQLDAFNGTIRGTPTRAGVYEFTIRVRDYDEKSRGQTRRLRIEIALAKSAAVAR